jgi:5'-nucleotidase/UDP-sugar diphosphatase
MLRKISFVLALLALAIFSSVALAQGNGFALTIMHTNDVHGAYGPYDTKQDPTTDGGAARQMTIINQIRAEGGNSILVDGGDRFTGTLFHQQWRGEEASRIMNMMKYDVMTVGNHEFDDGDNTLAKFVDSLNFPIITSDVTFGADLKDKIKPYTILEVGGQKIGVIGLTPPDTGILSSPGPDVKFNSDLAGVVQPIVDDLTKQGINKIMLLTHIGLVVDKDLATKLSNVDLIVGGHSHSLLSNAYTGAEGVYPIVVKDKDGKNVYIVQAGSSLKFMGRLNVQFDKDGVVTSASGDTILLSRYIQPDADMLKVVNELRVPISQLTKQDIGESSVFLVGDRKVCRAAECNMGNFIADAMRAYSKAQIAITNGGGIRSNVPVGADIPADLKLAEPIKITEGDVLTVFPFGNVVATFELKGSDVIAALENGVSQVEVGAGRFPQVSGIKFSWDGSKEAGKRIVRVDVLGADGNYSPIDPTATYTVASNDFMRRGGDGYSVFMDKAINPYDGGSPLDLVMVDYIKANSPIHPEVEGRITRVDKS